MPTLESLSLDINRISIKDLSRVSFLKSPNKVLAIVKKPLLKKIFFKHFNKKLIFRKQGFSGYPNDARILLRKEKKYSRINKLKLDFKEFKKNFSQRAYEWKLLNLELFLKFYSQLK